MPAKGFRARAGAAPADNERDRPVRAPSAQPAGNLRAAGLVLLIEPMQALSPRLRPLRAATPAAERADGSSPHPPSPPPPGCAPAPAEPPAPPPLSGGEAAALIALAQQGDVAAFQRLIAEYQAKVYGFARAFTPDAEQASDLTQEALIKIYRSIGGFRFQSSLLTWMFRIVKNVFLDHYKSRRHKERKLEQPLDGTHERDMICGTPEGRTPEAELLLREQQRALWAALDRVPEVYRTVLVLADMQGLSYEEVAAIVEAPIGTVKSRLNRGRDALRDVILLDRRLGQALRPGTGRQTS